ncbi:unnamed protein product [Knipowitschia caucasica]|uniref:Uncharacterized protein n=1 Tax=Knipowitschia caucasica TaxID=637954 RepID=A0AAV2M4Y6_KNICA
MAPDLAHVQKQTFQVLEHLLNDDSEVGFRSGDIETDGPDDEFDAASIAEKLRKVADALNEDANFQAKLRELKVAVAQEALEKTLHSGVDTLVQSHVGQKAEVAPELQLIKATMALGLYLKQTCPGLRQQLQTTIGTFLNQRVGPWIQEQGGWERVAAASQQNTSL